MRCYRTAVFLIAALCLPTASLALFHSGSHGFVSPSSASIHGSHTFTATGPGTWTVPAGITSITVGAWGGGGGQSPSGNNYGGAGGGYAGATITVTPGDTIYYNVGAGAAGVNSGNTLAAGPTWAQKNTNAAPSSSALGVNATGGDAITGGGYGAPAVGAGTVGTTLYSGGSTTGASGGAPGASGGGAGSGGNGVNGISSSWTGGAGGTPDGGAGGTSAWNGAGYDGAQPGGGAGGVYNGGGVTNRGGHGQLKITW